MVDEFIGKFLGVDRMDRRGVFGRVKFFYGVVEAQARGSLHIHLLIWLEGALSPRLIVEKCQSDVDFRARMFRWLESLFSHDFPEGTIPSAGSREEIKKHIMGRPPDPSKAGSDSTWPQYLHGVLDASSQVHTHNNTCFKKVSGGLRSFSEKEQDEHCRFMYPQDIVAETFMDDDGKIHIKRPNGRMVGYVPPITGCFACNTDGKFIGSGAFGMALSIYVVSYTAKNTLDSAIMASALAASLQQIGKSDSMTEQQRVAFLRKTLTQANIRRELSAQQVVSALLGKPSHYTNARFANCYWTKVLHWMDPSVFPAYCTSSGEAGYVSP
ncbi:hypothetical protein K435DRAFT_642008 [Dendrothele bispora CBS 962.96]|uniref:Helitron helicase-like domain-containing protein n=1 Tax=Dendrothele bispora (strain CBS 962.96) TaxID=1314807 RepID=A0A4S8MXJ1_DENBC|nr:hypothetical protein K435DRAFT_642008 [Dendrothele bispora CBS 962.96]